jgi:cell division protein ZapA
MDLMKQIKVKIYNQEYVIKSDESAEQLNRIADYVNDKLKEIQDNTEGLSEKKMAILVALNIASEYFLAIKERDELSVNIRQRTEALLNNIESVMD